MKQPLYQKLAQLTQARLNCEKSGNDEWFNKHEDKIAQLINDHLPSGSGIDSGNQFVFTRSTGEKLVICSSYRRMNENGMYCRWIDYTITVKASLQFGFELTISGRFGRHQDNEYLHEIYNQAFNHEVE